MHLFERGLIVLKIYSNKNQGTCLGKNWFIFFKFLCKNFSLDRKVECLRLYTYTVQTLSSKQRAHQSSLIFLINCKTVEHCL